LSQLPARLSRCRCAILDRDEHDCPDDDGVLLRVYVRDEPVFWHEEIADLE
jgi:hypothetical protein